MPDLDIVSRTVPRGWRKPMNLLLGSSASSTTVRATVQAATASLREHRGFPGFDEFAETLDEVMHGTLDSHSAHTRLDAIELRHGHARHPKVCAHAARAILAEIGFDRTLPMLSMRVLLARRAVSHLVETNLLGYLTPGRLRSRCPKPARVDQIQQELRGALDGLIRRLAHDVASDPTCADIRAPRISQARRLTTAELLDQSIM